MPKRCVLVGDYPTGTVSDATLPVPALMNRGVCVSCTPKWGPIPTLYGVRSSSFAKLINTEIKLLACQKPAKESERDKRRESERKTGQRCACLD